MENLTVNTPAPFSVSNLNTTSLEQVIGCFEQIRFCWNCNLCTKPGHTQKAYDRSLALYHEQLPLPVVFVGQAPAYCEERAGEPLVGAWELFSSRCGQCADLARCYKYQLHLSDEYKANEEVCPYAPGDEPKPLQDQSILVRRIQNLVLDMTFNKKAADPKEADPRTAGQQFDIMLASSGFIRPSGAYYWDRKKVIVDSEALPRVPNCAVINTIQCRSWEEDNGKKKNVAPTPEERIACARNVVQFIELIQPKVVVALGNDALHTLLGLRAVRSTTGEFVNAEVNGATVPGVNSVLGQELLCTLVDTLPYELKVIPICHPASHLHFRNCAERRTALANNDTTTLARLEAQYRADVAKSVTVLKRIFADYIGTGGQ